MSDAWRGGSTRQGRKVRASVLERDRWRCQVRVRGVCTETATCVHHTHGKGVTGDDPAYMVACCAPCNLRVGDPNRLGPGREVVEWVRAQGGPVRLGLAMARYPTSNVGQVLHRAIKRGEIVRVGRGLYAAGPVDLPPKVVGDPQPRGGTRW